MCPRCLEGARTRVKLRVSLDQSDDSFARFRYHRDQRKLETLVWQDRHAPAKAEDRIEHVADVVRQVAAQGNGVFQRAAPPEELSAVRLKLRRAAERGRRRNQ